MLKPDKYPRQHYQSIVTRWRPPTNTKGSMINVQSSGKLRMRVHTNHTKGQFENHVDAAIQLIKKFGWHGLWAVAGAKGEDDYVFVLVSRQEPSAIDIPNTCFYIAPEEK